MTSEAAIDRIVEKNMADDVEREHGGDGEGTQAELSSESLAFIAALEEIAINLQNISDEMGEGITSATAYSGKDLRIHLHPDKFKEITVGRDDIERKIWATQQLVCRSFTIRGVMVFCLDKARFQLVEE